MVLESFSAENILRVVLSLGEQSPLYATAGGKAILAALSDELIAELCPEPFEQLTTSTLSAFSELRDQVALIRETGFAYAREERTPGLSTIAMAVKTVLGIYALEVSVPEARYDDKKRHIEQALAACRQSIVASIGEAQIPPVGYVRIVNDCKQSKI